MTRTTSLYEPVLAEMSQVEETLSSLARVDTPWLRDMLAAVLFAGGKRMRPAVSLLAGKFGVFDPALSVPLAASLELLHTASLVHDDVVDGAGTRRGRPTAGSLFDNHGAVILGDYVFAQAAALVARTGHAEVVQIEYDPLQVSYEKLLDFFWSIHNPTTLNRQGPDAGSQYRSVIFYHNDEQKQKAEYYKNKLTKEKIWDKPIVTEISNLEKFYPAEDYHQEYYENNTNQGYCAYVITPKVEKFEKIFKDKLKK